MKVSTTELRNAAELLLAHLENNGTGEIELGADHYWDVPADQRYDRYDEPNQHTIGQLSADLKEIRGMLKGDATPIGYGLVWLAAIFRRVGETSIG